ncbi:cytochrome C biosynthesis protein [Anaerobacillus alkalidiazotrophicus]|uniref:Cytochrome C biosynthesis protein n=1 Tax=Anaerobacillus alkalidiazotrophicus TaxID=472963 RepID=A0A1S2M2P8_9BACI|nr:sulfite exporter TauE/SafE family protein [Anaerobacillus alkalidiazotrophicus]OIJ18894.1 cytochrome C biosynthesis protein [Anaerobacillus alkalidiazotrophicus]
MYQFLQQVSHFFSEPFMSAAYGTEHIPILSALLLGIVGALAPCQFTGNLSAITLFGNQSLQKKAAWGETIAFILGKIVAFSGLGFVVWMLGTEFQQSLITYFPWIRKLLGPLLIIIGLYLAGLFTMRWTLSLWKSKSEKSGKIGSFLLGLSFSLGFCPTMFILFFIVLMPMALAVPYGAVIPSIFALGTSIPLIISVFLIWYFGLSGTFMKKGKKIGWVVQRTAGIIIILIGILDTITYWELTVF